MSPDLLKSKKQNEEAKVKRQKKSKAKERKG
jgi:hypothetical protein